MTTDLLMQSFCTTICDRLSITQQVNSVEILYYFIIYLDKVYNILFFCFPAGILFRDNLPEINLREQE